MADYSKEEKEFFFIYDKEEYDKILSDKIKYNCFKCKNYKTGNCILIEIAVTAMYVCPHFEDKRGEQNRTTIYARSYFEDKKEEENDSIQIYYRRL